MDTVKKTLSWQISNLIWSVLMHIIPSKPYLAFRYRITNKHWIDWKHPKSFTEKIQWLKLYGRQKELAEYVDRISAKSFVGNEIGASFVIPTLCVWNSVAEIDWSLLPDQFVLKCNHDSGTTIICKDKKNFDVKAAKHQLNKALRNNYYLVGREMPYRYVSKKLFAEQYLPHTGSLVDYKFYVFHNHVEFCQVITNRDANETIDFFDREWQHQDFVGLNPNASNTSEALIRPRNYTQMIEIAESLASVIGQPFTRIDLYNVDSKIYFGEITFYPGNGFGRFRPESWDYRLGELIKL